MQLSFLLKTWSQKQNIYRWLWYWTVFFWTVESCIINRTTFIFMCPTGNERRASLGCRLLWATLLNWKVTKSKNLRATGGWQPSLIFFQDNSGIPWTCDWTRAENKWMQLLEEKLAVFLNFVKTLSYMLLSANHHERVQLLKSYLV